MADRVDENGAAFAGSQLQTQLYVNRRTGQLEDAVRSAFPELAGAKFDWRSPLAEERYAEYWDKGFLQRVDLGDRARDLEAFWPAGGPHWDGLAVISPSDDSRPGVLLLEGKSYPGEFEGGGCKAADGHSRHLIENSLAWTQSMIGVTGVSVETWCGRFYQSANRLAHLSWLRSLGVPAWLVHLLFVDDPHSETSADEWERSIRRVDEELGLPSAGVDSAGHVLLPAGPREELVGGA